MARGSGIRKWVKREIVAEEVSLEMEVLMVVGLMKEIWKGELQKLEILFQELEKLGYLVGKLENLQVDWLIVEILFQELEKLEYLDGELENLQVDWLIGEILIQI